MPLETRCGHCQRITPSSELVEIRGYRYCDRCFREHAFFCADCGRADWVNESYGNRQHRLCYNCWRQRNHWEPVEVESRENTFDITGSRRCFGVELETSLCPGHTSLKGKTCFGVKEDGSIAGLEFISPILCGDKGLTEVKNFCKLAHQRRFKSFDECGFHVHIDMRDTSSLQRRKVAFAYIATMDLWAACVDEERWDNCFCKLMEYTPQDVEGARSFEEFVDRRDRYEFVNWRAIRSHTTVEIRGYQGTLQATQICNWIMAHLRFVDFVKDKTFNELKAMFCNGPKRAKRMMRKIIGKRLSNYYAKKWRKDAGKFSYA